MGYFDDIESKIEGESPQKQIPEIVIPVISVGGVPAALAGLGDGSVLTTIKSSAAASCVSLPAKTAPAAPAAAEPIVSASTACGTGVLVVADDANSGVVCVGGAGVTISTGIQLSAGDSVFIPVADAALVYCVGSVAAQVLREIAL